jgi:hypothetical protein
VRAALSRRPGGADRRGDPGVAPLLRELRGRDIRVGVLSNTMWPRSEVPPHDVVPDAVISRLAELTAHLDTW